MANIKLNIWDIKRCSNCTWFDNDRIVIDLMFNEGICKMKTNDENAKLGMYVIRQMTTPACDKFNNKHYENE